MNVCTLKLFNEKTPVIISFQTTKSTKFNSTKAQRRSFKASLPSQGGVLTTKPLLNKIGFQEDKALRQKAEMNSNIRVPFTGDAVFSFPAITDPMKYKRQPIALKDIRCPQAKLLRGQNQIIYERLKEKYSAEMKEKPRRQPKIKTDIGFFRRVPLSKSLSRDHCVLPSTKSQLSVERKKSNKKDSNQRSTINFFKQGKFEFALKGAEKRFTTLHYESEAIKVKERSSDMNDSSFKKHIHSFQERKEEKEETFLQNQNTSCDLKANNENCGNRSRTFNRETNRTIEHNDDGKDLIIKGIEVNKRYEKVKSDNNLLDHKSLIENDKEKEADNKHNSSDHHPVLQSEVNEKQQAKEAEDNKEKDDSPSRKMRSSSSFNMKNINVSSIINKVIEDNKRAAEATSKHFFADIGRDFKSTHMSQSNINFFYSQNASKHSAASLDIPDHPFTFNNISIKLMNPLEWKKHEEVWTDLQSTTSASLQADRENGIVPPNDKDVLVSSYFRLFPQAVHRSELSKAETLSQKKDYCLSFIINDKVQNPKVEMRKWKDAYKRVIHRWHPDKLFGMLSHIKLNTAHTEAVLQRKSPLIINNTNTLYKSIMEILSKIASRKGG